MKKCLSVLSIIVAFATLSSAQTSLSQTGSRHLKKARIFIENAGSEGEWQLAVTELKAVKSSDPYYPETYLLLGDALSNIVSSSAALSESKENYLRYIELVPAQREAVQEKIDRLEALSEINSVRKRDAFLLGLVGKWSQNADSWGENCFDVSFVMDGGRIRMNYIGHLIVYEDRSHYCRWDFNYPEYRDEELHMSIFQYFFDFNNQDRADFSTYRIIIPYQEDTTASIRAKWYNDYADGRWVDTVFYRH